MDYRGIEIFTIGHLIDESQYRSDIGIDISSAVELQDTTGLRVIASGGVNSVEDVRRVHQAGLAGVIIGRALYEGKILLAECQKMQDMDG